jgi:crotonobetainyl-CoA:carnitine CoA-transferase CaiB-like acyl-CoA transferase
VPLDDDEYHAARVLAPAAFAARDRAEWIELFHAADLAALPVFRPTEVFDDDQVAHDRIVVDIEDPVLGSIRQVGRCVDYAATPSEPLTGAPRPGEHDDRLGELIAGTPPQPRPNGEPAVVAHPLAGVRILDFSTYFAGPYAARLLSDLGADVIKVEAIEGDPMRPLPDPFEGAQRGKRTIAVDLKSRAGLQVVHDLVATADVVMHNFRPGKAEKAGIGYEQLKALRPDLIYCYLPGFGSSGPKSSLKSFAPLLSGFVGNFFEGAGDGEPPVRRVMGNEDYYNGLNGAVAVLIALVCRDRTAQGQALESPQLRSALFCTTHNVRAADGTVHRPFVLDADQYGLGPFLRLYPTSDGHVCIACRSTGDVAQLRAATGVGAGEADPAAALGSWFAARTAQDAFDALERAGVPCEIALDYPLMPELLWDEWLVETNRVLEQHHPTWGWLREIGVLVRLSQTPPAVKGHGPMLGEHTRELLGELNYDEAAVQGLLASRACVAAEES